MVANTRYLVVMIASGLYVHDAHAGMAMVQDIGFYAAGPMSTVDLTRSGNLLAYTDHYRVASVRVHGIMATTSHRFDAPRLDHVTLLRFNRIGSLLAVAGADGDREVALFNAAGALLFSLRRSRFKSALIRSIDFHGDDDALVTMTSCTASVHLFDLSSPSLRLTSVVAPSRTFRLSAPGGGSCAVMRDADGEGRLLVATTRATEVFDLKRGESAVGKRLYDDDDHVTRDVTYDGRFVGSFRRNPAPLHRAYLSGPVHQFHPFAGGGVAITHTTEL